MGREICTHAMQEKMSVCVSVNSLLCACISVCVFSLQCELLIGAFSSLCRNLMRRRPCRSDATKTTTKAKKSVTMITHWFVYRLAGAHIQSKKCTYMTSFISHFHFTLPSQKSCCWDVNALNRLRAVCVSSSLHFCFLPPAACDDECSGLLLSDMDRLYRIITEVTLTTPLPPPYKMLYRFENMTEELKVRSVSPWLKVFVVVVLFFYSQV